MQSEDFGEVLAIYFLNLLAGIGMRIIHTSLCILDRGGGGNSLEIPLQKDGIFFFKKWSLKKDIVLFL